MSIVYRYGNSVEPIDCHYNPLDHNHKQSYNGKKIYDPCYMCDEANTTDTCDKCGSGVCDDTTCRLMFPHKYNTTYIVCATCAGEIDKKLVPLIDLGKLTLLKSKIKNNCTARSPRSSSRSSSSESTISLEQFNCYDNH